MQPDDAKATRRGFGDFGFGSRFDVLSATAQIRLAGSAETADPAATQIAAITAGRQRYPAVVMTVEEARRCPA
ncbi:hypothetical protein DYQ93_12335 [Xanthomonas sp. LMG 8992]|uniref:hypothetical protein n=1 Tax=Xanthomonas sp. LMG 8992 TaxID=1591157 RepID=UPI00136EB81B|nr:hypothetical protein [Xanthomonas sp. LMG 8992]MXV11810.1 hypothetical protein [Xanthomonas sp. LMG 8992]